MTEAKRTRRSTEPHNKPLSAEQIAWAVGVASRYVPAANCLTQALAATRMLERAGYDASLQIGVSRSESGPLDAHAWVDCEGRTVIGMSDELERFVPLAPAMSS